jgi:hypothetical protein
LSPVQPEGAREVSVNTFHSRKKQPSAVPGVQETIMDEIAGTPNTTDDIAGVLARIKVALVPDEAKELSSEATVQASLTWKLYVTPITKLVAVQDVVAQLVRAVPSQPVGVLPTTPPALNCTTQLLCWQVPVAPAFHAKISVVVAGYPVLGTLTMGADAGEPVSNAVVVFTGLLKLAIVHTC